MPPLETAAPAGLAAFLRVAREPVPRELVPDAAFARAEAAAAGLPPAYGFILECWLKEEEPDVDFQCFFTRGEGARLAESVPGTSPTWQGVRRAFREWQAAPELYEGLWLEYDLGAGDGGLDAPRLGFALEGMRGGLSPEERSAILARYERSLESGRQALSPGAARDEALLRTVRRALESMPDGARLYGTGYAPAPALSPLRWCVSMPTLEHAGRFLRAMGWAETEAFMSALPRPAPLDHVALNCDLSDGLGPKLGMEYYLRRGEQGPRPEDWRAFLRELASRGLCRERWIEPLLYEGRLLGRRGRERSWPSELGELGGLLGREYHISSRFAHVKIVWERGAWRAAKAYLYGSYG